MIITSASHAEVRKFEPRTNVVYILPTYVARRRFFMKQVIISKQLSLICIEILSVSIVLSTYDVV